MTTRATSTAQGSPFRKQWEALMHDPALKDLPFKVETNQHFQIVLSPPAPDHGFLQGEIYSLIRSHAENQGLKGRAAVEFSVETRRGVKVPDVIWMSSERRAKLPESIPASPVMPEIVVEVRSPSNTDQEMAEKRELYLHIGAADGTVAEEVWVVSPEGAVAFYGPGGQREQSAVLEDFPARVEL